MNKLILKSEATKNSVDTVVDVEHGTVSCIHHSQNKKAKASYLLKWVLDFSHISEEDKLRMCAEHLKIVIRRGFTEATSPKASDWDNVTFDAADFLVKKISKDAKRAATLDGMSDEQILEYLQNRKDDEGESDKE